MMWFLILLAIIGAILYVFLDAYNSLQRRAQEIRESLSNISVTMSKKVGLINQLVDVVKNYQDSENLVHLSAVKETGVSAVQSTLRDTSMVMTTVQSMADRYPNLKADQQYHRLIDNIEGLEDELAQYRKSYNSKVRGYNTSRASIPTIFVANALGFTNAPYLDMSMDNEGAILNEFKTDDGERLNALLNTAKNNIVDSSRSIAQSSRGAIDKAKNSQKKSLTDDLDVVETYFYMLPESTPKGPVTHQEIESLAADNDWCKNVRINQTTTEEWLTYNEWLTKDLTTTDEVENEVIIEPDVVDETITENKVIESEETKTTVDVGTTEKAS
ncbi:LemA family protein [Psychrobacter sp. 1U2]|uniref:LemA family protein n=1 Tax=Psychrobacter sp. 1U2 TaxID=3453577 RepID=UPI003F48A17E